MAFDIQVGNKHYKRDFLTDKASDVGQSVLALARTNKTPVFCLCAELPLPLFVRKDGNGFTLVKQRGHGSDHNPDCPSVIEYKDDSVRTNGKVDHLGQVLSRLKTGILDNDDLSFLLNHLWVMSGYAEWNPAFSESRGWNRLKFRLRKVAEGISLGDFTLSDILILPYENYGLSDSESIAYFNKIIKAIAFKERKYGIQPILIDTLIGIGEMKHSYPLKFHHLHFPLWMPKAETASLKQTAKFAFDHVDDTDLKSVGIFQIKVTPNHFLNTKHGHVLAVTDEWAPITNKQHHFIIKKLLQENRLFRMNLMNDGKLNIELLDTEPGVQRLYISPYDKIPANKGEWYWDSVNHYFPPAIPVPS